MRLWISYSVMRGSQKEWCMDGAGAISVDVSAYTTEERFTLFGKIVTLLAKSDVQIRKEEPPQKGLLDEVAWKEVQAPRAVYRTSQFLGMQVTGFLMVPTGGPATS